MKRTDSDIKQAVSNELRWDTRVDDADVGVSVTNGVVTLTGTVSSWGKRVAAQEAAHHVVGVLDVANDVQVRFPGDKARTDTDIATAVRRSLEWDVLVPEARIRSTVADGWVTLEGDVDLGIERQDAENAIRNLVGVRGITNRIQVRPAKLVSSDVRKAVEDALARRATREASRITVDVQNGCVSLSGAVHSWPERTAVIGAARATAGVHEVNVEGLDLEPYPT
jgi:osmotically-inducible protein OsmY